MDIKCNLIISTFAKMQPHKTAPREVYCMLRTIVIIAKCTHINGTYFIEFVCFLMRTVFFSLALLSLQSNLVLDKFDNDYKN